MNIKPLASVPSLAVLIPLLSVCAAVSAQTSPGATPTTVPVVTSSPTPPAPKPNDDWPVLQRYRVDDEALPPPASGEQRVVFMGDSITDRWGRAPGTGLFFPGKPYINRGIGGQTTPQMLVRFQQDVIHLRPAVVVILAGTNDIAGNTGPSTPQMIEDNLASMAQLAHANGIRVILASITPAFNYPWKKSVFPTAEILALNHWMSTYCAAHGCTYLDYYTAMVDAQGAMLPGYSIDGVHPLEKGYAVMAALAEKAIAQAQSQQP
jgi:lysophospholipase L1-like esterase